MDFSNNEESNNEENLRFNYIYPIINLNPFLPIIEETNMEPITINILNETGNETREMLTTNMNLILSTNNSFFPSSNLIERIFNDYILDKNKLSKDEYDKYTIRLDEKVKECPICFNESDKSVKIINCEHIFCETCIENWLLNHKNTCPLCRVNLKN
tara:strand:+ start:2327 stop:2797 length:471 start_codon:yes stop_codon:yes gene_type:complete